MSAPQQIGSPTEEKIRSLPIELWPEADRNAWISACQPGERLKRGGAGSRLKPITQRDLARRYGYFLDCMNRSGLLDPNKAAGGHVTPEYVTAYLAELNGRVSSVTTYGSIYRLRRACELIDPACDLSWLADIEKDLALVMRPRSKSDRWVLIEVLVEAGLSLIIEAENSGKTSKRSQARQVRNGLMVAMLAMHPIRLKNVATLDIGRSFVEIKGSWWIALPASETKEHRPDERRIDDLLKPALDRYLKRYRPWLAGADQSTAALWLSSNDGNPMTYEGVARVITETTRATIGLAVSPHLFRTAIATSAAIHGGAKPYLASALIHHTEHRITEAHYNRASNLTAANSFQEIIQQYVKD
jgi:integrase